MKKALITFLVLAAAGVMFFPTDAVAQNPIEDKIELSKEGGTTRIAGADRMMGMFSLRSTPQVAPEVEAYSSNNMVQISVLNYRGPAWVEITGRRGAKHASFEVYDMGFNVISLSGLATGEYRIRITLGDEVFTGTIDNRRNGRR